MCCPVYCCFINQNICEQWVSNQYTAFILLIYIRAGWEQTRLGNPEVRKVVEQAVQELVTEYLEMHPNTLEAILAKAFQALRVCGGLLKLQYLGSSSLWRNATNITGGNPT